MRTLAVVAAALLGAAPAVALAQEAPRPLAFAALSLAQAEDGAVASSPDVAGAQAVVRENAAALGAARAALGPSVVSTYTQAPQGGAVGTITQHLTTVGVQTTVGDVLGYSPLVASANATLRGAQASLAATTRAERVKVIGLYYDALKARAIAQARDEALRTAQQQRDAAQIRVKAGDAPRLDLVRANVAVARATASAETARAADQNATEALQVETGVRVALDRTVDQPLPPVVTVGTDTAVAQAHANRADLRAAAETTAAARAAATAAHRQTFPALTVGAGYTSGVDSGVNIHGPNLNVSMNLPLGGAARQQALQKDAIVAEDVAKQRALERQIALDIAASARNVGAAQRATAASSEARAEAQTELQATQLGYRNGASSSLELASARDTYVQAVVDELSAVYDELKARATLTLETGS